MCFQANARSFLRFLTVTSPRGPSERRALQAAEKRSTVVILSAAKDLALRIFMNIRDSSSPVG